MEFFVTFHWDSGSVFSRAVSGTAKPVLISFDAIDIPQDSLAGLLKRLQPVLQSLGEPSVCARDTSVARRARGAPKDKAIWRRNGAETFWAIGGHPETPDERRAGTYPPASLQIFTYRTSDVLISSPYTGAVTRKDAGCFQTK
jgi:hypothetical protein